MCMHTNHHGFYTRSETERYCSCSQKDPVVLARLKKQNSLVSYITRRFVYKLIVLTINIKIERTVNVCHTFVMRTSTASDACQLPITIHININLLLNTKKQITTYHFDNNVENKREKQ